MGEHLGSVKVLHGTCLSENERASQPPGSVPIGEEPTEMIVPKSSSEIFRPAAASLETTCSFESLSKAHLLQTTNPTALLSGLVTLSPKPYANNAFSWNPHIRDEWTRKSVFVPIRPMRCCHRTSSHRLPRCLSVGHLACLIWARKKRSRLRRLSGSLVCLSSFTCSPTLGTWEDHVDNTVMYMNSVKEANTQTRTPATSLSSSAVWWLDGTAALGNVNRKAVFSLSTSPDLNSHSTAPPKDPIPDRHLLLPGRSDFEDELVSEVAHFELSEYLIGELEYLNCLDLYQPESADEPIPSADRAAEFLTTSKLRDNSSEFSLRRPSLSRSLSHLGLLTYIDNHQDSETSVPVAVEPVVSRSPFTDFFGVVQEGMLLDFDRSDEELADNCSTHTAEELLQTRIVTALAADLVTFCMEQRAGQVDSMAFLKDLHQLLMQTCDADWAFRERSCDWGMGMKPKQLLLGCSLLPSSSAVMMSSLESGGRQTNLIPLGPNPNHSRVRSSSLTVMKSGKDDSVEKGTAIHHPVSQVKELKAAQLESWSDWNTHMSSLAAPQPRKVTYDLPEDKLRSLSSSRQSVSTRLSDRCNSVDALCTPLQYALLINLPVPKSRRKSILASQANRCAGCGAFVETRYLKRMRFCEFFGKFFCCVCHTNTLMVLPGNVLTNWDFRGAPVSNVARDRLTQLYRQPLFPFADFSPLLRNQAALRNCSALRNQGHLMLPFVRVCSKAGGLLDDLESLPPHLLEAPNLWSISDLCDVYNNRLESVLLKVLQPLADHLIVCPRCRSQGFVCEICHSGHILFPFGQPNTTICPNCAACFHRTCLRNPKPESCPRCVRRIQRRRQYESRASVAELVGSGEREFFIGNC